MSLNATEIGIVVEVLNRELGGAVVRKVISPAAPDRLALELRTPGENHYLQIVTLTGATRIGRVAKKPHAAEIPHPFVMLLRGEALGMVVEQVCQIAGDRAVRVDFKASGRAGALICELTSRHANLFWLDAKDRISGSFYPNRSHKRQLVPGEPYVPPIPHPAGGGPQEARFSGFDPEARIEAHYRLSEAAKERQQAEDRTRRLAQKASRHLERLIKKLDQDRARAEEGDRLAFQGQLLKANLHLAKRGIEHLDVVDFEGNQAFIALDPRRGPVENMERLFSRSKRLRRAVPRIEERQTKIQQNRECIKSLIDEIATATPERLAEIRAQIKGRFPQFRDPSPKRRRDEHERLPYREYVVATGRTARVGRSAKDNDALTLRFARPDDLWLHVRGRPGSHVVVPLGRGEEPTPDLLVDAAHLAAHFSDARGDTDVEVVHTRRRYVQKPRGAAPGSVRLIKEKTLFLRVEQNRLERLLQSD